jgi:hypothetical protein
MCQKGNLVSASSASWLSLGFSSTDYNPVLEILGSYWAPLIPLTCIFEFDYYF